MRRRPSTPRLRSCSCSRCSAPGALRRLRRHELLDPAAPHTIAESLGATPACSATTSRSPPRRSCSGSARARARLRARRADPPLPAPAPRLLSPHGRLAGGADRGDRTAARVPARLRPAAEADRDRPDLLLPGRRHDRRRARRRRPRPTEAAAHARRLAPAGVSLCRAAGGAAGGDQRRADRRHRRRDRRLHRRVPDRDLGRLLRAGSRDQRRPLVATDLAPYAAAVVLFAFAIACFYTLSEIERRLAPWANQSRGDIR